MKKLLSVFVLLAIFSCETPPKKKEVKPIPVKEPVKEVVVGKKVEKNPVTAYENKPRAPFQVPVSPTIKPDTPSSLVSN